MVAVNYHRLVTHETRINERVVEPKHRLRIIANIEELADIDLCHLRLLIENNHPKDPIRHIAVREYLPIKVLLNFLGPTDVA